MPKDIMGRPFAVGQTVVHATRSGNSGCLTVKEVTRVTDQEVFLRYPGDEKSKGRAVWFTDRVAIVEDPS